MSLKGEEYQEMYQINYKNIESAIKGLKEFFGMSVCENSDQIDMSKAYQGYNFTCFIYNKWYV